MAMIAVDALSYSFGRAEVLHDVTLAVPDGAVYALLGPNGAGKTTLLQILMGLRPARAGRVQLLGTDIRELTRDQRTRISYVAEGQPLPGWMRLEQLESYLAPLYPTWDPSLARELRERFALNGRGRIDTLSRGERMKAAVLCALAPRPKLLLMDEPFTGMDVLVKDDLVRGLLESAGSEGWTVLISSHDLSELEPLADWVGLLEHGRMLVSEPMDRLRERFKRVTMLTGDTGSAVTPVADDVWLSIERAGRRITFVTPNGAGDYAARLHEAYPTAEHIDVREASLREIFVAMARAAVGRADEVAA
ncbi:MAG TPA: ABC transporter ATP-binding protein [Gemmatimonadaceae bacterium]